jgi:hypothetical protein
VRVGALADALPELVSLRLNPVLVAPDGAVVIDAVAVVESAPLAAPAPMRSLG